jgi:hypothetical protein
MPPPPAGPLRQDSPHRSRTALTISDHVSQVRYLSAAEANLRFGMGHTAGAIVVALRRPIGGSLDRPQR